MSVPHTPYTPVMWFVWTISLVLSQLSSESRRDQEEGGELDFHEEVSPEEIKSREVVLGWRVRLLLLQLFPIGGATDIVL